MTAPTPATGPVTITPDDLAPFAEIKADKANAMITHALARATLKAPCIATEEFKHTAAAKAVIVEAILRWNDAGTGAVTQDVVGPFQQTVDTTVRRRGLFTPSELEELEEMCRDNAKGKAWSYDTAGYGSISHADVCSLRLGANFCSCGADIAGTPLWENDGG